MKKKYRLKKSVRRILYSFIGILIGAVYALTVNAVAFETNITIEEGTISIEDYEFFKDKKVIQVNLPNSIVQLGFSAFEGCSELVTINFPDGLSVIDNRAFARCDNLSKIELPNSVVFIGNAAFYGCNNIKNIKLPNGIIDLSNNIFYDCENLREVELPETLNSIGQQSFYNCNSLNNIDLPSNLKSIGEGAFYDCINLTELYIPDTVEFIGLDAFCGCDNLMIIAEPGSYAEKYAKDNGIRCISSEVESDLLPVKSTITNNNINSDVPPTGVNSHYLSVIILLIISIVGLFALNNNSNIINYNK